MAKKTSKKPVVSYEDLFVQLGLGNISEAEKARLAAQMQENIEGRIMVRILSSFSDADKTAFDKCKTNEEIDALFAAKNIDTDKIAAEEVLAFREELIKDAAYIEGKLSNMKK